MENINIVEVSSKATKREFVEFAKELYRNEPRWIAPLDSSVEAIFNPKSNPHFKSGYAQRWLAYNSKNKCVGRIAAFYTAPPSMSETLRVGGCGFFEAIDSSEVANALFTTTRQWLEDRGFNAMDSPINFGSREAWWGLLVKGFEHTPLFENNYNHPYYQQLFEGYGFRCYFNQFTYRWRVGIESANPKLDMRSQRLLARGDYTIRSIKKDELKEAINWFTDIYNRAWSHFPDIEPLSKQQGERLYNSIRPIIDYNLIHFALYRDEAVGFLIAIPDINSIIADFNGKLSPLHKLLLWWRLRVTKSCDRVFGVVFGISPEHQGRGVESALITSLRDGYILTKQNRNYRSLEFAWIGDFNPVMCRVMEGYIGAECHKQHTTYRLLFDTNLEFERHPVLKYF